MKKKDRKKDQNQKKDRKEEIEQTQERNDQSLEVEIQVVFEDQPLAGATVWLEEIIDDRRTTVQNRLPPIVTNQAGIVGFSLLCNSNEFQVFARHEDGLSGLGKFYYRKEYEKADENEIHRIQLTMGRTQPIQGRLFLENKPIAGVTCRIDVITRLLKIESNAFTDGRGVQPQPGIDEFSVEATTDWNGHFSLDGYPAHCKLRLILEKKNIGRSSIEFSANTMMEWELKEPGSLAISIEGETGPTWIGKFDLRSLDNPQEFSAQGREIVRLYPVKRINDYFFSAPGMEGVAQGSFELIIPLDPELAYHYGPSQVIKVEPRKTTEVILKKFPKSCCCGRILDSVTGKGIANLNIQLAGTKKWQEDIKFFLDQEFTDTIEGKTDAEGRYSIFCKGDHDYTVRFEPAECDYEPPSWNHASRAWHSLVPHRFVAFAEEAQFPDILLKRWRPLTTTLKDEEGKPITGPLVVYALNRRSMDEVPYEIEKGKLNLTKVRPDVPLHFFIRKEKAVNLPAVLSLDALDSPIDFTISEANQVICTGQIVDRKRKPVTEASVRLLWTSPIPRDPSKPQETAWMSTILLETRKPNEQGVFRFEGLWPGQRYYPEIYASGYHRWCYLDGATLPDSPGKKAGPGETIDFGMLVLIKD